jgi:hypothetical protein
MLSKILVKKSAGVFLCFSVWLGEIQAQGRVNGLWTSSIVGESVPRTVFETKTGYVFESDVQNFGKQDALRTEIEAGHRIHVASHFYLRLGLAYNRFDFGKTSGPLPDHLQSFAGVISIERMQGKHVGAFFSIKPGFYTEDHLGLESFDAPMTIGSIFVLQKDKLYLFAGATASFLRGKLPVLPLLGIIWLPCDNLRLMGVVPDPRIVYSPIKNLDLWIGGELVGGSFRTDHDEDILPRKLSGTQVDYSDYRAGLGLTYSPHDGVSLDFGAGYSIQRSFDFNRAGEDYRADPAPYFRLAIKARF